MRGGAVGSQGGGWWSGPKSWLDAGLGFFYPEVCQCCRAEPAQPTDGYVGRDCRSGVRLIAPPFCEKCGLPYGGKVSTPFECSNCRSLDLAFDWARAAAAATGVVLDAIHRYKYRRERWFEPFLARLLVDAALRSLDVGQWDCLVPVPLHPSKERRREFNQAVRLARQLSRFTGLRVQEQWLERRARTETQTHLSRHRRAENVRDAFDLRTGSKPGRCRVILVDDVLTTGSTASECARVLREAGADAVGVWTVARGL